MDPRYGVAAVVAASVALVAIRAPHGQRSRSVPVAVRRKGTLEVVLLTLAWIGFFLPFLWMGTDLLSGFDIPLHPAAFGAGAAVTVAGLWLFHRSHADLGTNWSITLEVREGHRLVTEGVYARVRHPMYGALLLFGAGIALLCPNLVAGPAYLVAGLLITFGRLGPEERMMRERFGAEWEAYAGRTGRLVPGVW